MISCLAFLTLLGAPVLNLIGIVKVGRAYRAGNMVKMLSGGTMLVGSIVLLGIIGGISNLSR